MGLRLIEGKTGFISIKKIHIVSWNDTGKFLKFTLIFLKNTFLGNEKDVGINDSIYKIVSSSTGVVIGSV